jgi:hypothetical protein
VSSENFYQVSNEYILKKISDKIYKNFNIIDASRDFLVCDLESQFIDLTYVFLHHLFNFVSENNLGPNFNYSGFLKMLKRINMDQKEECFLIEIDSDKTTEEEVKEDNELIQQNSLAKRSSSSSIRLTPSKMGQMAGQIFDKIVLNIVGQAKKFVSEQNSLLEVMLV